MVPDSPASDEIRRFEEQYRLQPESLVFARLADAYRKAGRPEKALEVLEDGLIRHPDYPSGHIVRARALRDMGQVDETLESFRRVLELDGANLVAIRELAGMADERGDVGEARHWYERLGQIDPTNREVRQRLSELEVPTAAVPAAEPPGGPVEDEDEDETEGPHTWWDDSAVNLPADDGAADRGWGDETESDFDGSEDARRPEDEVVEAILNGDVPQTVRAEDTWWYEEAPELGEPEPSKDADLLTRTMADLYAEQGLRREAAEIYEELLKDSPDDPELMARLEAVRAEGWDVPGAPAPDSAVPHQETDAGPIPLARPAGAPWTDELRRLLRLGEESAASLPDPETYDATSAEGLAAVSAAGDGVLSAEGADEGESDPVGDPEGRGPSRFAREWIQRMETDG